MDRKHKLFEETYVIKEQCMKEDTATGELAVDAPGADPSGQDPV